MSLELLFRQRSGYLDAQVSGKWTTDGAKKAIDGIRAEADKQGLTLLLIDLLKLSKPDTEITRFFTGYHYAMVLPPPFKSAAVMKTELYNKFAENVALNRGAAVAVFFDEEKALEWLLKDAGKVAPR